MPSPFFNTKKQEPDQSNPDGTTLTGVKLSEGATSVDNSQGDQKPENRKEAIPEVQESYPELRRFRSALSQASKTLNKFSNYLEDLMN